MLDHAARELGCPDLGLRLAEAADITVLGPLAHAIEASPTVAEAISCASRFLFVHSPALMFEQTDDPLGWPGVMALTYRKDLRESHYSPQAIELGLGLLYRIAKTLRGSHTGLRSVQLPHRPLSPLDRYVEFFGADVKFGCAPAALRVERHLLKEQFRSADASRRQLALEHLTDTFHDPNTTTTARVRSAVAERLGTSAPSTDEVARLLVMNSRTLQRRLAAEGTSFTAVLDNVRRIAARRYITTTDLPFIDIAALVGFSEQSALSRAVQRWDGCSPRALRAEGPRAVQIRRRPASPR